MSREVLGQIACPECGGAAEVKRTKAGLAYRWCLDCHAQYFPRTAEASDRLIAKCGGGAAKAATVTATAPEPAPAPAPAKARAAPAPAPAKERAAPAPAPAKERAAPAPAPATPRNGLSDALAMLGVK